VDCGYRVDLLVEDKLIIELKSVEQIECIHEAHLLTYMEMAGLKLAFLMNFNVTKLRGGSSASSSDSFVSFVVKRFCTSARALALGLSL